MSVRGFLDWGNWGREIHPKCGHHPKGGRRVLEQYNEDSADHQNLSTLLPICRLMVTNTSCFFPAKWTISLQTIRQNKLSPKSLLLRYEVMAIRTGPEMDLWGASMVCLCAVLLSDWLKSKGARCSTPHCVTDNTSEQNVIRMDVIWD